MGETGKERMENLAPLMTFLCLSFLWYIHSEHGDKIPDCMDMVNQKVFRHKLNCERRSVIMVLLTEMVSAVKC